MIIKDKLLKIVKVSDELIHKSCVMREEVDKELHLVNLAEKGELNLTTNHKEAFMLRHNELKASLQESLQELP